MGYTGLVVPQTQYLCSELGDPFLSKGKGEGNGEKFPEVAEISESSSCRANIPSLV